MNCELDNPNSGRHICITWIQKVERLFLNVNQRILNTHILFKVYQSQVSKSPCTSTIHTHTPKLITYLYNFVHFWGWWWWRYFQTGFNLFIGYKIRIKRKDAFQINLCKQGHESYRADRWLLNDFNLKMTWHHFANYSAQNNNPHILNTCFLIMLVKSDHQNYVIITYIQQLSNLVHWAQEQMIQGETLLLWVNF